MEQIFFGCAIFFLNLLIWIFGSGKWVNFGIGDGLIDLIQISVSLILVSLEIISVSLESVLLEVVDCLFSFRVDNLQSNNVFIKSFHLNGDYT